MTLRTALALAALAGLAAAARAQDDAASHEWSQPRGDAARTACVDVGPVDEPPVVAWRLEMPGGAVATPVAWNGVVYALSQTKAQEVTLSAVRAATGELLASRRLGKLEWADLAVLRGTVFVVDPALVRSIRFDGKQFTSGWATKGSWAGQPAVIRGAVVVADASSVHVLDAATGRDAVPPVCVNSSSDPNDFATTCVTDWSPTDVEIARLCGTVSLRLERVTGLGTRTPSADRGDFVNNAFRTADKSADRRPRAAWLTSLGRVWLATYPPGFWAEGDKYSYGAVLLQRSGSGFQLPIWAPVAVVKNVAYGMGRDGVAYAVKFDGSYTTLTKPGSLPRGARMGSASATRGVVYFGNWAMDVASGRVLWCLPDVAPVTPLVPVGDGRAVVIDENTDLVGIAEPGAAADGAASAAPTGTPAAPPDLPGDADGALLADGRFVAGTPEAADGGRLRVRPAAGDPQEFAAGDWALAQQNAKAVAVGEERLVLAALEETLDRRSAAAWADVYRKYADVPLVADALRVLAAAKRDGLPEDRLRDLERLVTGKRDPANADLQRKRVAAIEKTARDAHVESVRAASRWCRARGLGGAAAALLSRVREERPDDAATEAAARELVPAGFPWAKEPDAGARWIRWSREIVPAGGAFVPPDAPEAAAKRAPPWDRDVVLLTTRNVLLVSRTSDPAVVGPCLRHAEGAIRACESVIGAASPAATARRMEVRLHADRASYLAEVTPDGTKAREWSAGYYSGAEQVSRFHVPPRDEDAVTPLERSLLRVLAHELTHQWVDLRWEPRGRAGGATPGYWCVEGIARFIDEQSVEMGRRAGRTDDATVMSLDVVSQLDASLRLLAPSKLVAMSHDDFDRLTDAPKVEVKLRWTARTLLVDPRDAFYHESAALVFWLVHRRGPEGRAAFVEVLRRRYRGTVAADCARDLGFESAAAMDREFRAFLAGLRR